MSEIKPVAWTSKSQLSLARDKPGDNVIMWGEPLPHHDDIALCRHDEAMVEIERLTNERDAAFAMSRCECGTDEACTNLVAKDDKIERLRVERDNLEMAYRHAMLCFYGAIKATNPTDLAEVAVTAAIAGNGPRSCRPSKPSIQNDV